MDCIHRINTPRMDKIAAGSLVAHALRPYVSWSALAPAGCGFVISKRHWHSLYPLGKEIGLGNPNAINGNEYAKRVYLAHNVNIIYCTIKLYQNIYMYLWVDFGSLIEKLWWLSTVGGFTLSSKFFMFQSSQDHVWTIPPPTHLFTSFRKLSPWTTTADSTALVFLFSQLPGTVCSVFRGEMMRCEMHEWRYLKNFWRDLCKFQHGNHGICSVFIWIYYHSWKPKWPLSWLDNFGLLFCGSKTTKTGHSQ